MKCQEALKMSDMQAFIVSSDDEDDISITSTAPSEARETYPLECILAERTVEEEDDDGLFVEGKEYLVKWEGYDVDRSTWEPGSNFENSDTLHDWQAQSMRQARLLIDVFDVDAWEQRQENIRQAKEKRHARRNRRRQKRGLPVTYWPEEEEEAGNEESNSTYEGEELITVVSSPPPPTLKDDKPKRKPPIFDSSSDNSSGSDTPLSPLKRKRSLISNRPLKKPSIDEDMRKGRAVPVKQAKATLGAIVPQTEQSRDLDIAHSAAPKRAPVVVQGWFNSFTQPQAPAARSGATSSTLSIRNGPPPTVSSGPLMKRTSASNAPRKTTGKSN